MQTMTNELRNKIRNYIKSGIDISDLIRDIDIRNEDLSHATILDFDKHGQDISNCKLTGAKIIKANLSHTLARNVVFNYADLSEGDCTYMDALNSAFVHATCIRTNFSNADLRNCDIGGITLTISPRYLYHTKISKNIITVFDHFWSRIEDNSTMKCTEPT